MKSAENNHALSDYYYKKINKNIPTPLHIWKYADGDFELIDYNEAADKLLHGKMESILGVKASEAFFDTPEIFEDLKACYEEKKTISKQFAFNFEITQEEKVLSVQYIFVPPDLVLGYHEDITEKANLERKQKEYKLQLYKKDHLIQRTFQSLKEAIFILDSSKPPLIIDCNKAAEDVFKYNKSEMIGKTTAFLHTSTQSLEDFQKKLYPQIRRNGYFDIQNFHMRRKQGETFETDVSVVPLESQESSRIGWVSVVKDITNIEKIKQQRELSDEKYRSLFKSAVIGILILNEEGTVIECNPAIESILGYSEEEVVGKDHLFIRSVLKPARLFLRQIHDEIKEKGLIEPLEYIVKTKNNEEKRIMLQISKFSVSGVNYYQALFQDIDNLKKTKSKLEVSKDKYQKLLQNLSDIIAELTYEGTISYVSPQIKDVLGYDPEELIGKNFRRLVHPEDLSHVEKKLQRDALSGSPFYLENRALHKENHYLPMSVRGNIVKGEDGKIRFLGVFRDISERKKAENKIKIRLRIENTLKDISSKFINVKDYNRAIIYSLKKLGKLLSADRSYVYLFNQERNQLINTHHWGENYGEKELINLDDEEFGFFLSWMKNKKITDYIYIPNIESIPERNHGIKNYFRKKPLLPILCYPIESEGTLLGLIGFNRINLSDYWTEEDLSLLTISSEIIGNAIEKKISEETLKNSQNLLKGVISSITDYILIINLNHEIVWASDYALEFFGKDILMKKYSELFPQSGNIPKIICTNAIKGNSFERDIQIRNSVFHLTSNPASSNSEGEAELIVIILRPIKKKSENEF